MRTAFAGCGMLLKLLTLPALALGRLGIETALLEFDEETLALAELLELAQGLLKAVPIRNSYFYHVIHQPFLSCIFYKCGFIIEAFGAMSTRKSA